MAHMFRKRVYLQFTTFRVEVVEVVPTRVRLARRPEAARFSASGTPERDALHLHSAHTARSTDAKLTPHAGAGAGAEKLAAGASAASSATATAGAGASFFFAAALAATIFAARARTCAAACASASAAAAARARAA